MSTRQKITIGAIGGRKPKPRLNAAASAPKPKPANPAKPAKPAKQAKPPKPANPPPKKTPPSVKKARRHMSGFKAVREYMPLVIGARELLQAGRTRREQEVITRRLGHHVNSVRYLTAVAAEDSMRHSLDGLAVEPVSDIHRAYARARLAEIAQKQATTEEASNGTA
jgi:hypothetical protein